MTDAARTQRRKALYLIGVVPSILLLSVSGRILLMLQNDASGHRGYEAKNYSRAADEFGDNRFPNPIQRWIAPFNEGDAHFRLQDYCEAIAAFDTALRVVPAKRECIVRINLALAHEAAGDASAKGRGDIVLREWKAARTAVRGCLALEEISKTDETSAKRVDKRITGKLGIKVPRPKVAKVPRPDARTKALERELEQQNKEARLKRAARDNRNKSGEIRDNPQW